MRDHLVVQVGRPTRMVWDDVDALADLRLPGASAEIDVAMLLRLPVGHRFRVVGKVAVAAGGRGIVGERL